MNTTDTNFKPTPGPWIYQKTASLGPQYAVYPESTGNDVALVYDAENAESNAALIAEAGTVYHETGKTPARLAEENREMHELLAVLPELPEDWNEYNPDAVLAFEKAFTWFKTKLEETIAKAKGTK